MSNFSLIQTVIERLASLDPLEIQIADESELHKNHKGHTPGSSHLSLTISSASFNGLSTIKCHHLIYNLLKDLIPHPLHALEINIIRRDK